MGRLAVLVAIAAGGAAAYYWAAGPVDRPLPVPPPAVTTNTPPLLVTPPSVQRAYAALMAGEIEQARSEYQRVLTAEPGSLDALHGLAAVSLRAGQAEAAGRYYLRAIEVDPQDILAHTGLASLWAKSHPRAAEDRLQALLARQPELSFVNYALGNLYAGQARWSEAQRAFFQAYRGEPDNPDILFNLAVSFDHLQQSKQALSFYRLALAAAEQRPASFDRRQAVTRLSALQK